MSRTAFEDGEQRWHAFGIVDGYMMLLVVHTLWEEDEAGDTIEVIRVISARQADRKERQKYENEIR